MAGHPGEWAALVAVRKRPPPQLLGGISGDLEDARPGSRIPETVFEHFRESDNLTTAVNLPTGALCDGSV